MNIYQRLTCNTKEKLGGSILKSLSFGTGCADFAEIFFKSHVITKYKKSRTFGIPFLFEKLSNRAPKKVWVLKGILNQSANFSYVVVQRFLNPEW